MYEGDLLYDLTVARLTDALDSEDRNYVIESPDGAEDTVDVAWRDGDRAKALQFRFSDTDDRYGFELHGYVWEDDTEFPPLGSKEWEGVGTDLLAFHDDRDLHRTFPAALYGDEEAFEEADDYVNALVVEKYSMLDDDVL
ncbi:MAG: hypothetical protein SV186_02885 [Candidatus Nanohaloarchaea archaeon]|nr:hypothetical protein [Candidatus Nanohaloarchaea archaeon]